MSRAVSMSTRSADEDVTSFSIVGLTVWAIWRDAVPKVWVIAKKFLELEAVASKYVSPDDDVNMLQRTYRSNTSVVAYFCTSS
jgi:hypothetical protein